MDIITQWDLLFPFFIKSAIVCFGLLGGGGYLFCKYFGFHEPEDDIDSIDTTKS